jgi:Fe2+ or Zn2+ uptake regulation protein
MKLSPALEQLRENGFRITRVRRALTDIFLSSKRPLSVDVLIPLLKKRRISVNKTTVYRELDFLLEQELLQELHLKGTKLYYEWKKHHHHHVVCRECSSVQDIDAGEVEKLLPRLERKLTRKTLFTELSHSLEFSGLCHRCS